MTEGLKPKRWYVVKAIAGKEKKLRNILKMKLLIADLKNMFLRF
jgi:transcription antitermination factor NusG